MFYSKMLIDGELVESISGKTTTILNPANQEPVALVSEGDRQDACRALEAAQNAFSNWSTKSPQNRSELLHSAAELVRQRVDGIARLLTLEQGKPIRDAKREVSASADALDYYAEEGKRNYGQWFDSHNLKSKSLVIRQPIGVAALITPWNLPVDLLAWKIGPALAAGCTIVAKPPSLAPLAATEFVKAVNDSGVPPGVVNMVHGKGDEVGAELVENPISRKIAFTGETGTGRWIMSHAAQHIKRISLELGGQSPFIVCEDASLNKAVPACVQRAFSNMGQICISVNRVYVAETIAEKFISELVERTLKLKIGNGLDADVDLGPMFSEQQRQKTKDHIDDALRKGAKLLCGGREPEGQQYGKGFFFLPTVISDANHTMRIMREETFGPVAPIMTFKTLDEAIRLANDSDYGLAAYIFTDDLNTSIYAAEKLEAGGIGVNINNVADLQAPFGGWKQSGFGRERGHYGLDAFMEIKHIRFGF
jgi:succinate-semialdehyde dehydrogenase / glutarate-semialdehyde dehydrogenase